MRIYYFKQKKIKTFHPTANDDIKDCVVGYCGVNWKFRGAGWEHTYTPMKFVLKTKNKVLVKMKLPTK